MSTFQKGIDLCESFFDEVARPILAAEFPTLRYSAGLIGYGSDVLGFDDPMSTDHMWGPRFQLFLPIDDFGVTSTQIAEVFSARLPYRYKGYSVHFGPPDPLDGGTRVREEIQSGRVDPLIEYHTPTSFFQEYLGWDPNTDVTNEHWLTIPEQRLLGATSGKFFRDDLGIDRVRCKLTYYPHDTWLWLMASQWKMIAEEEPFTGRCGFVGDDTGSRIVAARQVQRLMRLAFLMERHYAPYSKWLGTAFRHLSIAPRLTPLFEQVLNASQWEDRDEFLGRSYSVLAEQHNALNLTEFLSVETTHFFNRPFHVISAQRFTTALQNIIEDPWLRSLPPIGSVSQLTDAVPVNDDVGISRKLTSLYQ